ncbi:hypothetical protein WJX73_005220 [Symbiochloris irregularis]|uniref:Uncharacterized protein n=1 Tax=Symbiochloris irregularis TaxID=706552 RepID=A0AAW1NF22_9CHLO
MLSHCNRGLLFTNRAAGHAHFGPARLIVAKSSRAFRKQPRVYATSDKKDAVTSAKDLFIKLYQSQWTSSLCTAGVISGWRLHSEQEVTQQVVLREVLIGGCVFCFVFFIYEPLLSTQAQRLLVKAYTALRRVNPFGKSPQDFPDNLFIAFFVAFLTVPEGDAFNLAFVLRTALLFAGLYFGARLLLLAASIGWENLFPPETWDECITQRRQEFQLTPAERAALEDGLGVARVEQAFDDVLRFEDLKAEAESKGLQATYRKHLTWLRISTVERMGSESPYFEMFWPPELASRHLK